MGASQSREGREFTDSDSDYDEQEDESVEDEYQDAQSHSQPHSHSTQLDEVDAKLKALKLKYPSSSPSPSPKNTVKLYLHIGGNTPNAKWILSDKRTFYTFVKIEEDNDNDDEDEQNDAAQGPWILKVGSKISARVSTELQLKMFGDQRRDHTFENVYGLAPTEENKIKVYGKEFIGWVKPEVADDSVWEDASEDGFRKSPEPYRSRGDLMEEFEEAANGGNSQGC
ncbi:unnamed protein product [Vicia faba]|uniref:DUF7135 domain-containing protein n=1 Tax=Vicia faba TaxID=3906 RepID=A0AAV1B710_VICFA|nr:unnamed protein product [Vicia faba]